MEDVRSRRDGSISCPEGKIFMKDLTVKTEYGELFGCYHRTLSMLKCKGLHPICDSNNTDILASIENMLKIVIPGLTMSTLVLYMTASNITIIFEISETSHTKIRCLHSSITLTMDEI